MSSAFHGQATLHLHPFEDPPIEASLKLVAMSLQGGRIDVWCHPGSQLVIRVWPAERPCYVFTSRRLSFTSDDHFELAVLCDEKMALAWINGEPAAAMGYTMADDGPLSVRLPSWAVRQVESCQSWCDKATQEALERRKRLASSATAKPHRRLLTQAEHLGALQREVNQIHDLATLVRAGARDHVIGLSARIRAVACYMARKRDLPLLQTCAAIANVGLPVFMPAPHWADYGNKPDVELGSRVFPNPIHSTDIQLDLDVWLSLPLFRFGGTHYSNNDVLRAIADTMGGAHHDKSVDPNIESIRTHTSTVMGTPHSFDMLSAFVVEVGAAILALSEDVVERRP